MEGIGSMILELQDHLNLGTENVAYSVTRFEERSSLEKAREHHSIVFGQKVASWT